MSTTRRDFLISAAGTMGAMAIVPELALGSPRPASAGPLKIGLIGCGRQGRSMLTELAKMENIQITGLCDVDETRANSAARRTQGAEAFTSHKAMLEKLKDLDAVIVATPTHLHKDPTVDALSAGKHVYCEMPLAHTAEDARAIASAALAAKTLCAVGLEGRSNPVYKLARTFYRSDAVREAIAIEAQNHQKTTWRFPAADRNRENEVNWRLDPAVSTGLAGELGVHQFDVGTWYSDKLPTSVRGFGSIRLHADGREIADTILLELAYADGLRMSYSASLCNSYEGAYELFYGAPTPRSAWPGAHGWMFKEADAPTQGWEVYANRQQFHNDEGITLIADATKLAEQGKLKEGVGLPTRACTTRCGISSIA
jgi:predicted dehydrogenase